MGQAWNALGRWPLAVRIKRYIDDVSEMQEAARQRLRMRRFYSRILAPGALCFDIGANIGARTAIFVDLGARVIAVEPQETCVRQLRLRFATVPTVVIAPVAVTDYEGYADLAVCDEATTIATLSDRWRTEGRFAQEHTWRRTERVPATTLDSLIAQYGVPVFCKIDVEGFELSVLRGLSQPIPVISFEFNRELLDQMHLCVQHLLTLGPARFNCSLGESLEFLFARQVTADTLFHALETRVDPLLWGDVYAFFRA